LSIPRYINVFLTISRVLASSLQQKKIDHNPFDFICPLPSPGFDRNQVKGHAFTLILLKSKDYNKSTVLGVAAGVNLCNKVMQDDKAVEEWYQGKLKTHVTISSGKYLQAHISSSPVNRLTSRNKP
jgi:structural maintenance of chromosome 2